MGTLYELTGEYLQLLEMLSEEEGLEEQVIKDTLEGIGGELEAKADGYARVIRELDAEAEKYEKEAGRMQRLADIRKNRSRMLKDSLYKTMKVTGKVKFQTGLFRFAIQKNGGQQPLEIIPGKEIPDEYMRKEPDNAKIREALKNGRELPFAALRERGDHLVIR